MKIGYQLFSAIRFCQGAEGLKDTIRKIAALGYDGVEFCSYEGIPAAEMKEFLAECGVEAMNSHVQLERWEKDPEGEILYAKEAGIPCVTIPWMAPELRNAEGYEMIKKLIRKLVPLCKEQGIRLCYHNHHFEFEKTENGGYAMDEILAADSGCRAELDTFWSRYAEVDSAAYMEAKKDKLEMIHVKDYISLDGGPMAGGLEMPLFAAIGTGKMDNAPIFKKALELGLAWVIVEQDNSQIDVFEAAALSVKCLKEAFA